MARGQKPRENEREDDILRELRARSNRGDGFSSRQLDGTLLAMVVVCVQARGGQIAFGSTKDGSRGVITVWYKGFPTKAYYETPEEAEQTLAYTLDIFAPKTQEYDEWRKYAEDFKNPL